jgi:tetratricopeptide (TPR) repeat protein
MRLDSRDPYSLFLAGQLAFLSGSAGAAAELFEALVEAGFESPTAHSVMAAVARSDGNLAAAGAHLAAAAELAPTDATIVHEQASVAAEEGDTIAQIGFLDSLARLDQHDVESSLRVAEYALGVEDLERASFFADRAIDIAPFRSDVQALSGRVAARTQRWAVARRDLELALAAGPEDREPLLRALLATYEALSLNEDAERVRRELIE